MSEKILERCPCCGDASDYDTDEEIDGWFAFCMNRSCGCRSGIFPTKPMARNAWNTRASSPAEDLVTTEPVAFTNEAQLGFLKEPGYRVVPMAMWAFQHSAHPIALYATPAPPQPGPDEIAEYLYTKFCADPSVEWQDAPEKLKEVWRRYAGEIAALSGEKEKPE